MQLICEDMRYTINLFEVATFDGPGDTRCIYLRVKWAGSMFHQIAFLYYMYVVYVYSN